ncbi:ArsA-related P-loop ATPase [Corynebacterium sp. 335C]
MTGKGGTGKSTVAAALAVGLAAGGGRVLLVDVEARHSAAAPLGLASLPATPGRIAAAEGGGEVHGCAPTGEAVLEDYLRTNFAGAVAGSAMRRLGVPEFVTAIAPGLKDVLLSGFLVEEARRGGWDAVVADAPPTGRIARFLDVTRALTDIAAAGPVHRQARETAAYLRSGEVAVHVTALAEPLPVTESLEAIGELLGMGLTVGTIAVNKVLDADVAAAAERVAMRDDAPGAAPVPGLGAEAGAALVEEARDAAARAAVQREALAELESGWDGRLVRLPAIPGGVRVEGIYRIAELLMGGEDGAADAAGSADAEGGSDDATREERQ